MHIAFCAWLTSPQTSPVFIVLLLEPFLEPQMYMNSGFFNLSISIFILNLNLNLNRKAILIIGAILTPWKILLKGLYSDEFEYHASNREVFYSNLF